MEISQRKREVIKTEDGQYITVPDGDAATQQEIFEFEHKRRTKTYRLLRAKTVQVTPFSVAPTGMLYLLLHDAIEAKKRSWYQSSHWDHKPTKEELEAERKYEKDCEEAAEEAEFIAAQIFYALTGKEPHIEK